MLRAVARTGELVQRLRARVARLAGERMALRRTGTLARRDWHSAEALWPDLFGDDRDGK